jgi:orotate phosphoribosyltransferase
MVAIFSYQLPAADKNFEKEKCKLITLADYDSMISRALENNYIKDSDFQSLSEWRNDPKKWAEKRKDD